MIIIEEKLFFRCIWGATIAENAFYECKLKKTGG